MNEFSGPVAGPTNSIVDVPGLQVGHRTAAGEGWLTGTTVVLAPPGGAVGGVDVRGGAPGTRETDLLDPRNAVERVNAVVLGGGSAFGLAAADGVMQVLAARGEGVNVDTGAHTVTVPIVPAAVLFDLGRGGDPNRRPGAEFGRDAATAASSEPPAQGNVGAGTGAVAGGYKGGIGTASTLLPDGTTVAALVAANSAGSPVDPGSGEPWGLRHGLSGEFPSGPFGPPPSAPTEPGVALNTTIGVIATDAALSKAQCAKLAGVAHDGIARAVNPVHTMFDGDTIIALSTTTAPIPDPLGLHALLTAAGDCVARAIVHALLAAAPVSTSAGSWPIMAPRGSR